MTPDGTERVELTEGELELLSTLLIRDGTPVDDPDYDSLREKVESARRSLRTGVDR